MENISKNESNWEIGHFGVNGYDLNVSLVANAFENNTINVDYLKKLRLLDWENNCVFNKEYLTSINKNQELIKEDLNIEANSFIPLIYDGHASLLISDKNNKLYLFDTGGDGRDELSNIKNICKIRQWGECCGYSITESILNNKGILDINLSHQNDIIINKKIIEYEQMGDFDVTNYLISTNNNIASLNSGNLTPNETKKLFCESCYNINHISNLMTYTVEKNGRTEDITRQLTVQWDRDEFLKQFKEKYDNISKRNRLDVLDEIKNSYKDQLKELINKKNYNFVDIDDLDALCHKNYDDLTTSQQYIRKIVLDNFKGFNKEYLRNEFNEQQKIRALKVNNKQQDKTTRIEHI
mgnify:CR=1 FL=1